MKNKFESNVASKTPKEKSEEPNLPWQVGAKDIEKVSGVEGDSAKITASPLRTRAEVLVIILVAIFIVTIGFVSFMKKENERSKNEITKKEETVTALESQVSKLADEKSAISSNLTKLEKRVDELSAQKELFANVLEGLAKKSEEPAPQTDMAKDAALTNAQQPEEVPEPPKN